MSSDFNRKEPSKTEKVLYELFMQQQRLDQNLATTSAHAVALSFLLDVKPEKIAELLVSGGDKLKEYSKKINEEIDRLAEEAKKNQAPAAATETEVSPVHDHSHEDGHTH